MKIKFLNEKNRIYIISAAIAAVTLVLCLKLYRSQSDNSQRLQAEVSEERQRQALRKDIAKIDAIAKDYQRYLYNKNNVSGVRDTISDIAREAAVDIVSIEELASEKVGNYTKLYLKVTLICTYNQLGNFLAKVENLPALTKFEEIISVVRKERVASGAGEAPKIEEARAETSLVISGYSLSS